MTAGSWTAEGRWYGKFVDIKCSSGSGRHGSDCLAADYVSTAFFPSSFNAGMWNSLGADRRTDSGGNNTALASRSFIKMNRYSVTELKMAVKIKKLQTKEPKKHRGSTLVSSV